MKLCVFGESVSVMEGDSVTLNTDVSVIDKDDDVTWKFGAENSLIAKISIKNVLFSTNNVLDGRFRDRLKVNRQTASLTITNIRSEHAGEYQLEINGVKLTSKIFSVSVYARLPVPHLNSSQCSSSSSSSSVQYCSVLCSVVNASAVSLSWYKENCLLSSISVSDLSISLSLPLEVEYQDNNTYSCVINNTISNQTTHLDINTLCQTCEDGLPVFYVAFLCTGASLLIVVIIVMCCKKWRKTGQERNRSAKWEPKANRSLMKVLQDVLQTVCVIDV
ncbi:SLAM family member 6-like [Danio aesculapii]|uniref:SLAM family member 6-like n=1 Tax=Danio aesculapii TaxID=1142201 RepID=UPI0024BF4362|nr:SLAM family member 6-like [Danio aesculapii]